MANDANISRRRTLAGLYAVTPDATDTGRLIMNVRAALAGGARAIQYRNKSASPTLAAEQANALAAVCRDRALFIVNDNAVLARAVGADGVHVGEDDGEVAGLRARYGTEFMIGVSCYNDLILAEAAVAAGADYVAFGSFFASGMKPLARRADVTLLREARALGVPVVAIGGITSANAAPLVAAGADALAVISDVFERPDNVAVEQAAAAIAAFFRIHKEK